MQIAQVKNLDTEEINEYHYANTMRHDDIITDAEQKSKLIWGDDAKVQITISHFPE